MISISIDPEYDTPEVLTEYAGWYKNHGDWFFLSGDYDEIDYLRHVLGVYDPDPIIDADKTQHAGLIVFGDDKTDRWSALPGLMPAPHLAKHIARIVRQVVTPREVLNAWKLG